MDLDLATIADYSANTSEGKLVIAGVFDTIWVQELPAVQPFMSVVLRIRAHAGEEGGHDVRVRLVDADGQDVIPVMEGQIMFAELDPLDGGTAQLILQLAGTEIESTGHFSVDVFLDGRFERSIPLFVKKAPDQPEE